MSRAYIAKGKKFSVKDQDGNNLERYGFSWIKADTTFEESKQIIFELVERVAFGYEKSKSKKSCYLIDKARSIDDTGQDNFPSEAIKINHNLTATIGGKSTGKSLLLYYIAKIIDTRVVNNRFADHPTATRYNLTIRRILILKWYRPMEKTLILKKLKV